MESHISYETEQAAHELAKRFIRPYVARGDSFENLKASHMGMLCSEESVCIGGWMDGKSYNTDFILVSKVIGKPANVSFKLRDIFREVEGEIKSAEAVDDFHLEPG
ncbi:MAG: hypothetical protein BWY28_03067 [bacterium ADurb.Bin236]|nr:MAG: hypothetical protein BWY28_03067 [bacterium ADurb.Bin236]